jgi:hypothetical protein
MKKSKIDSKLYQLTLEKMVIGLEEPILIKGVGEIIAKVDSGNGGYNVIHGEDLVVQGNILTFKTFNKDGTERRVSKKIKETLNVNIGGGHIQERPVVELDVQFGGQDYKKILFSVTDRSGNDNKVLISKDFVGKELDALIDVNKTKIADDAIEVEYVSEGIIADAGRRVAQATGFKTDVQSKVKKDVNVNGEQTYKVKSNKQKKGSWVDRFYDASQRFKKWVDGEGALFDDVEEFFKGPELLAKFLKSDAEVIRKAILKESKAISDLGVDPYSIQVYKILDFLGGSCVEGKYVQEAEITEKQKLKDKLKKAQEKIAELKKQAEEAENAKPATTEDDDSDDEKNDTSGGASDSSSDTNKQVIKEADENAAGTPGGATSPPPGTAQPEGADASGADQSAGGDPNAEIEKITTDVEEIKGKLEEFKVAEEGRDFFVIYYAAFTKTKEGENLSEGTKITDGTPGQLVIQNGPNIMAQKINDGVVKDFATKLQPEIEKNNSRGLFAYCVGANMPRKPVIIKDVLIGVNAGEGGSGDETSDDAEIENFVEQYKEISAKVMGIADDLGQEHDEVDEEYINTLIELAGGEATERSPEMKEFIQQYSELNARFHEIADDMVSSEQMLDEQLIDDLIQMAKEFSDEKSTEEAQNDPGDQWNDANYYDWENNVENEEQPIK